MIVNRTELHRAYPIKDMSTQKLRAHGISYGLTEAGYDIRIKQDIWFTNRLYASGIQQEISVNGILTPGRFVIASAIEEFHMPHDLVGVVHDKSTWARLGLSVFNTVIEPGFCGGLTLELVYHGQGELIIPAGVGIAQVLFTRIAVEAQYNGKYQNQSSNPVPAIFE